jgi:hypothetical protein
LDGFRALAYVGEGICRLVSRNRNAFKTFEPLAKAIGQELSGCSVVLDGESASRAGLPAHVLRVDAPPRPVLFLRI